MAATSTSDTTSATSNEGPVLSLINKRIRALRKKLNRITQMEESVAQGKSLNKEQQEVLRSKPGVLALVDELEKLRSPLSTAVAEEHALAIHHHNHQNQEQHDAEDEKEAEAEQQQQQSQPPSEPAKSEDEHPAVRTEEEGVEDLLKLLYFGSLFDVIPQSEFTSTMLTRTHERGCCLTYDYVTDDATDLLGEKDLDLIAAMKGMLISRPVDSSLSHKNALQSCIQRAKLWIANSDQPIDQRSDITYAGLREKLSKIISSDYYTTSPEMKGPADMAVFGSFQVPLQTSMMPVQVQAQVHEPVTQYQETEENATASMEEYGTNGSHQSAPVEEYQKGVLDRDNTAEEFSNQVEEQHESQQNLEEYSMRSRDVEYKEDDQQQYIPRRPYQNQQGVGGGSRVRGGGRRGGYLNGRGGRGGSSRGGGGGYQNGGRGQYYDQGGNYYPSRNHYRGRGGRGGGNSSNNYYQGRGGGADVGVTSS